MVLSSMHITPVHCSVSKFKALVWSLLTLLLGSQQLPMLSLARSGPAQPRHLPLPLPGPPGWLTVLTGASQHPIVEPHLTSPLSPLMMIITHVEGRDKLIMITYYIVVGVGIVIILQKY